MPDAHYVIDLIAGKTVTPAPNFDAQRGRRGRARARLRDAREALVRRRPALAVQAGRELHVQVREPRRHQLVRDLRRLDPLCARRVPRRLLRGSVMRRLAMILEPCALAFGVGCGEDNGVAPGRRSRDAPVDAGRPTRRASRTPHPLRDHQRVHDRAEDLQGLAPAAAPAGRWLAAAAALIVAHAVAAAAEPEPLRPAVTHHGWPIELTGYVQVDAVASSAGVGGRARSATGEPLNEEQFVIRRARLRADAHRDALSGALEFDGNTITARPRACSARRSAGSSPREHERAARRGHRGLVQDAVRRRDADERARQGVPRAADVRARAVPRRLRRRRDGAAARTACARWSVAMMNGAPVGDAQWKGKDPSASYDLVGRVGARHRTGRVARASTSGVSALSRQGPAPRHAADEGPAAVGRREPGRHRPDHRAAGDPRHDGRAVGRLRSQRARRRPPGPLVPVPRSATAPRSSRP